jgi:hypothetical protein
MAGVPLTRAAAITSLTRRQAVVRLHRQIGSAASIGSRCSRRNFTQTILDTTLVIWRLGEALLHAASLAKLLKRDESAAIMVRFRARYTGLSGRVLKAWANPFVDLLVEGAAARSDEAILEAEFPAAEIERNLAQYVVPLVASLFERFNVTGLAVDRVQAELERFQKSRVPARK